MKYITTYAIILLNIHDNNYNNKTKILKYKCLNKWHLRSKIIQYMNDNNITDYRIVKTLYDYEYDDWQQKRLYNNHISKINERR